MWNELVDTFMNDLVRPAMVLIIPAILIIIKSYVDKIVNSVVEKNKIANQCAESEIKKNEMETLSAQTNIQSNVMEDIEHVVEAAVCINMDLAEEMKLKEPDGKLSRNQAEMLNNQAKTNIYTAIDGIMKDNELLTILGGAVCIKTLVDGLLEKYVTEQKIKRKKK